MKKVLETVDRRQQDFLRAVYELADRRAKNSIAFTDVSKSLGRSEDDTDEVCDFWTDRGMVEWTRLGHIALTYLGLRKAKHLAGL
jgi:Mn-dependent DtxR family transcriptional regulator